MEGSEPPAKRRKITPNAGRRPGTRASLARAQQDNSTLPAYTYRALKKENEIRIFKVEKIGPNEWQYDIEHTTLTHAPPFETVSYVWGPDTRRNILRLRDDRTIRINNNLAQALPYLSAECKTGYLWIDQININQSSTQERNHQVKMMGDIYRSGERVIAWLGTEEKPSKQLLALIEVVRSSLEVRETLSLTKAKILEYLPKCRSTDFAILLRLLQSAWFSRAWVFQEIVLSKHATFLFGDIALPFLALIWISKAFARSKIPDTARLQGKTSDKSAQDSVKPTLYDDIASAHGFHMLSLMHRSRHAVIANFNWSTCPPFLWVLSEISPRLQTTDCRDSVYAFLGLQPQGIISVEADYASTYRETLINTASSIIRNMSSLEILSYCERDSGPHLLSGLPSWVPEWRAPVSAPILRVRDINAISGKHYWLGNTESSGLRVRGVCLDTISTCFAPEFRLRATTWYNENLEDYLALDERLDLVQKHTSCSSARLLDVILTDRYMPDVEQNYHGITTHHSNSLLVSAYYSCVRLYKDNQVVEESQDTRFLRSHTRLVHARQLFLTDSQCLGHVKQPSKGDKIYTLEGFPSLIVLRPCGNDRFTVVGTCHVEDQFWDLHNVKGNSLQGMPFWEKHEGKELVLV